MTPMSRPVLVLILGSALGLGACASGGPASLGGPAPLTPTSRYSLQAEAGLDRIALAVHQTGLSANQQNALGDLVRRFALSGSRDVVVEAPSGGDQGAASVAWSVREALVQYGVPAERVRVITYQAPNPRAPVLAGFEIVTAVVPQCGRAWGSLTRTGDNQSASNFGCAVTANLAAQVTNPRDLNSPREMTVADPARRSVVFENYVAGKPTAAPQETLLTNASVKQAVE